MNWTDCKRIANARKGCRTLGRKGRQFLGIIAEKFGSIGGSTVKMKFAVGRRGHTSVDTGNLRPQDGSVQIDRAGDRHHVSLSPREFWRLYEFCRSQERFAAFGVSGAT